MDTIQTLPTVSPNNTVRDDIKRAVKGYSNQVTAFALEGLFDNMESSFWGSENSGDIIKYLFIQNVAPAMGDLFGIEKQLENQALKAQGLDIYMQKVPNSLDSFALQPQGGFDVRF